jgi:hypothetical protein
MGFLQVAASNISTLSSSGGFALALAVTVGGGDALAHVVTAGAALAHGGQETCGDSV